MLNRKIKKRLSRIPEHYSARIDRSLELILGCDDPGPAELKNAKTRRKKGRILPALCTSMAAAFVCVLCFLFACPAYAADIPVLNRIIYTISPTVTEGAAAESQAAEKVSAVLKEFMESDVLLYTGQEQTGGNWQINVDTLHAAYYFKQRIQENGGGQNGPPEITIELQSVEAKRKGYEITAQVICRISGDGIESFSEMIQAVLIEKPEHLTVVGMKEVEEPPWDGDSGRKL